MVDARPSAKNTQQYPVGDSKFPDRLARGVELPQLKPVAGQIGPYELVAELGSGGMGTVYVAQRTYEVGVTRTVALKTLRHDLATKPGLVEMFLDEARITARISHPYVCAVMDIGLHRGVPYVTMDYLVGEPLSRLGALMAEDRSESSLAIVTRTVANLCEGLHAAHELRDERGELMHVVHRDVSPDNLFVLYDGSVRVADFGVAVTAAHQKEGRGSALAGKSGYMSPEQLRGQAIDRRSDVWAMGVVLWELLAGKRLFRPGSDIAATVAVLEGAIPPVSRFHSQVPRGLELVIERALERDRDKRYPTARAMALELEQVLARCFGPVSAGQVSAWLDQQFAHCQEFRRGIVARARELQSQLGDLEFDPRLGILVSTPPPSEEQVRTQVYERHESLASVDVPLDGLHDAPPATSLGSVPTPRRKRARRLVLGAVALAAVALMLFARGTSDVAPPRAAEPAAPPAAVAEPVIAPQPPPALPDAPLPAREAPAAEQPAVPAAKPLPRRSPATQAAKLGEVYVFAQSGSYEVVLPGRTLKAPALLKLPVGTQHIVVRKEGERSTKQVQVAPQPGRPMMVRLDL